MQSPLKTMGEGPLTLMRPSDLFQTTATTFSSLQPTALSISNKRLMYTSLVEKKQNKLKLSW